jgi:hypothetical protein
LVNENLKTGNVRSVGEGCPQTGYLETDALIPTFTAQHPKLHPTIEIIKAAHGTLAILNF